MAAMIRNRGLGIAIKVSDGTRRAVTVALFGVLQKMGLLTTLEQTAPEKSHHTTCSELRERSLVTSDHRRKPSARPLTQPESVQGGLITGHQFTLGRKRVLGILLVISS